MQLICGNRSPPGLQLVEKLTTPLLIMKNLTDWKNCGSQCGSASGGKVLWRFCSVCQTACAILRSISQSTPENHPLKNFVLNNVSQPSSCNFSAIYILEDLRHTSYMFHKNIVTNKLHYTCHFAILLWGSLKLLRRYPCKTSPDK